jgi:hypothetical protein
MNTVMATNFHMQELNNGLRFRARQDLRRWERLLIAAIVAAVIGMASSSFSSRVVVDCFIGHRRSCDVRCSKK